MEYATEIASFRQRAVSLMALDDDDDDAAELQYIQAQLHQPTLRLRKGEPVDEAKFMLNLSADLVMRRQNASAVTTTTTTMS